MVQIGSPDYGNCRAFFGSNFSGETVEKWKYLLYNEVK